MKREFIIVEGIFRKEGTSHQRAAWLGVYYNHNAEIKVGEQMILEQPIGDRQLATSIVKSVSQMRDLVLVETANTTYLLRIVREGCSYE